MADRCRCCRPERPWVQVLAAALLAAMEMLSLVSGSRRFCIVLPPHLSALGWGAYPGLWQCPYTCVCSVHALLPAPDHSPAQGNPERQRGIQTDLRTKQRHEKGGGNSELISKMPRISGGGLNGQIFVKTRRKPRARDAVSKAVSTAGQQLLLWAPAVCTALGPAVCARGCWLPSLRTACSLQRRDSLV